MKKLLALTLCLVLALTAAGCGAKETPAPTEAPAAVAPVEEAPAQEPTVPANVKSPMTGEEFSALMESQGFTNSESKEVANSGLTGIQYHASKAFLESEGLPAIDVYFMVYDLGGISEEKFMETVRAEAETYFNGSIPNLTEGDNWFCIKDYSAGELKLTNITVGNTVITIQAKDLGEDTPDALKAFDELPAALGF